MTEHAEQRVGPAERRVSGGTWGKRRKRRDTRRKAVQPGDRAIFRTPPSRPTSSVAHHNGQEVLVVRRSGAAYPGEDLWVVADPEDREFEAWGWELRRLPVNQPRQGLRDTNQGSGYWEWYLGEAERQSDDREGR